MVSTGTIVKFRRLLIVDNEINTKLQIKPCGDGLYFIGGDLFCTYKLLGTTVNDNSVVFDYEKYTITVSWENSNNNKRINPKWKRIYKTN